MTNYMTYNNQKHGFHLVDPSPWPLIAASGAFMLTFGMAMYMHGYSGGSFDIYHWVFSG